MIDDIHFCTFCNGSIPKSSDSLQLLGKDICHKCKGKVLGLIGGFSIVAVGGVAYVLITFVMSLVDNAREFFDTDKGEAVAIVAACSLGVGAVSQAVYSVYRAFMQLLRIAIIIAGGAAAAYLIGQEGIDWLPAILGCGIATGIRCLSMSMIADIDSLRKQVASRE